MPAIYRNGIQYSGTPPLASGIKYDNQTSGLIATRVQSAIDEIKGIIDDLESDISDLSTLKDTVEEITELLGNTDISSISDGTITGAIQTLSTTLLEKFPVGAIYLCVNDDDPSTIFGGTWAKIEGKFLLASSSYYHLGTTGGSADLIVPYHNHTFTGSSTTTTTTGSTHSHMAYNYSGSYIQNENTGRSDGDVGTVGWGSTKKNNFYVKTDIDGSHTHTLTPKGSVGYAGTSGNLTGANMPPYIVVNVWYRTA